MINVSKKVSYLKGLIDGLEINENTKEGKAINAIIDVLEEISESINELEKGYDELSELADNIDHDLGALEEDFYDLEEDDDECSCCGDEVFELECPSCGDLVCVDEGMLTEDFVTCPNCGKEIEYDFDIEGLDECCENNK